MTVLDTNVLSEVMKPLPSDKVVAWLAAQPASETHVTAVTRAEMLLGIELLPAGRRRETIAEAIRNVFARFSAPILPFDADAADLFATITAGRKRSGRPMEVMDAQIAAIALSHGATLATRDAADFAYCGVRLINPWRA
jgi:toxin FitB